MSSTGKWNLQESFWRGLIEEGLKEDGWPWDWTTLSLDGRGRVQKATLKAKSDGIWAGQGLVSALVAVSSLKVEGFLRNGDPFKKGDVLVRWEGSALEVLGLERTFINLCAYVCGIATVTHQMVATVTKACPEHAPRVTATRKTLPYYKDVALYGVLAGGGFSHRVNLAGGVLLKENHLKVEGGLTTAVKNAKERAPHPLRIEVEVESLSQMKEAMQAGADGVLLDNFTPAEVATALKEVEAFRKTRPFFIEVSGGITLENVASFAQKGVDVISCGSLSHSVKSSDLSLLLE